MLPTFILIQGQQTLFIFFQVSTVNVFVYRSEVYGKGFIKPFKIHPDTFVQMAIQLAYYKLHGK